MRPHRHAVLYVLVQRFQHLLGALQAGARLLQGRLGGVKLGLDGLRALHLCGGVAGAGEGGGRGACVRARALRVRVCMHMQLRGTLSAWAAAAPNASGSGWRRLHAPSRPICTTCFEKSGATSNQGVRACRQPGAPSLAGAPTSCVPVLCPGFSSKTLPKSRSALAKLQAYIHDTWQAWARSTVRWVVHQHAPMQSGRSPTCMQSAMLASAPPPPRGQSPLLCLHAACARAQSYTHAFIPPAWPQKQWAGHAQDAGGGSMCMCM